MDDLAGQIIKNYEIRERIGIGGFGSVYRAYQPIVDREVAIKIILPQYANQAHFIRNFENEARLIAKLEHIHIVPLFDFWRDPTGAFIVMRLLRGGSLQDSIKKDGPWSIESSATLLEQMASALAIAHRHGVVHQDIKAANILLDEEGNAYLTDFGIAKDLTQNKMPNADGEGGEEEVLHGSPEYMSPEQILRSPVDARSDIYSLGVVMYEVLTGKKPFQSKDDEELIRQQLYDSLPPLQGLRPDLPELFNVVIQRATDKNPRRRYTTPVNMAENFRQFADLSKNGGTAVPIAPPPAERVSAKEINIAELLAEPVNPYKGLRAFQETDSADFFGRDKLIEGLHQRVRADAGVAQGLSRFLAVVGPSGSGKSSVVKAGLIPRLRSQNDAWYIGEMTPGAHPMQELETVLLRVAQENDIPITQMLRSGPDGLARAIDATLGTVFEEMILLIDQFEEVFTMVADEGERRHFMDILRQAVLVEDSRLRIIVTLRADFYDRPLMYSGFGELMQKRTEVVLPLSAEELEAAIVKPAERVGLTLEEGLVSEIINEVVGQPGTLPLLQYALTELFANKRGNTLTLKSYRDSGGVSGAMTRRADELYLMMTPEIRMVAEQVFLRLVSLGEGTEDTRRRAMLSELLSMEGDRNVIQNVIDTFGKRRLLAFDIDPRTRAPTVEIAHEALIRTWMQLREWLNTNRDALRQQRQLATATTEWLSSNRDGSFLATGARLAQFEMLLGHSVVALNVDEQTYLNSSMQKRERARLRLVMFIASLAFIAFIAVIAAIFAFSSQQREEAARKVATSRELAITALTNTTQLDLAALLSLESYLTADTFEARDTLLTVLQREQYFTANLHAYMHGHTGNVRTVAVSPDGTRIATGGQDNTVRLWDTTTYQPVGTPLIGHGDWINKVVFSPDGNLVASGSSDDTIRLWATATGQPVGEPLVGHIGHIWGLAFSPDGTRLASASDDDTIRLWDVVSGGQIGDALVGHEGDVLAVAFRPDDTMLVSGGADDVVRRWDVALESETFGQQMGEPLVGHTDWVRSVAFSPDGRLIASGGSDRVPRLWAASAGLLLDTQFSQLAGAIRDITFNTAGNALITGSEDPNNAIVIWDIATSLVRDTWNMPDTSQVWGVALNPDNTMMVTASENPAALIWDLRDSVRLGKMLRVGAEGESTLPFTHVAFDSSGQEIVALSNDLNDDQGDAFIERWQVADKEGANSTENVVMQTLPRTVTAAAFSPDKTVLATASLDGDVLFTAVQTGQPIGQPFRMPNEDVRSLAYSADGNILAVGLGTGAIRLWQNNGGAWVAIERQFTGHIDRVTALAFSPDGTMLASGSRDSTVRLWRVTTGDSVGDVTPVTVNDEAVISLAFSPDGTLLASGDRDNTLTIWDVETFSPLYTEDAHTNWVTSVAFSPDGQLLASASLDQTLILWDMSDPGSLRQLGERLTGHFAGVNHVVFSPDGNALASVADNQTAIVWQLNIEHWMHEACTFANRNLTPEEWTIYLRDLPYHATCSPGSASVS